MTYNYGIIDKVVVGKAALNSDHSRVILQQTASHQSVVSMDKQPSFSAKFALPSKQSCMAFNLFDLLYKL